MLEVLILTGVLPTSHWPDVTVSSRLKSGTKPSSPYITIVSTLHTSPIGIVPKHDGRWRLIMHLSYPPGQGVNSFIDQKD
jgi:hypothetical protein